MWRRFARHCNERLRCCQHIRRSISFRNLAKYVKMCCCCLCKNLSFCFCLKVGIFIWIGRTRTHIVRGHYCQSSKEARSMARLCRHGKIIHFYNFVRMNNKQYRKKNNNNFFGKECKYAEAASCRRIYERIAAQKLSSKQMHSVLKRWLAFEQTHGTPADAQAVRERARAYVASLVKAIISIHCKLFNI